MGTSNVNAWNLCIIQKSDQVLSIATWSNVPLIATGTFSKQACSWIFIQQFGLSQELHQCTELIFLPPPFLLRYTRFPLSVNVQATHELKLLCFRFHTQYNHFLKAFLQGTVSGREHFIPFNGTVRHKTFLDWIFCAGLYSGRQRFIWHAARKPEPFSR